MKREKLPTSLLEAVRYFADERKAWQCVVNRRWADGNVTCPRCGSEKVHLIETRMIWRCNGCKRQFSVKVGTIFEDSPIPFSKWLPAMWLIANCKNGISSCEIAKDLEVTQKTAWFMLQRIRLAMQEDGKGLFGGQVEVDETYIGGKVRNMHKERKPKGTGMIGKSIVIGFLERGGKVRTHHLPNTTRPMMEGVVRANIQEGSSLFTDAHGSYRFMNQWFHHQFVDHAVNYAEGVVHTNSLENYWSLLKRTIRGTYVSIEPFHLFRYLDEQAFRFNERKDNDAGRFVTALSQVVGRRLTYRELTGKTVYAQ